MDIQTFVTEALVQIQEGVQNAIDRRMSSDTNTGAINPQFSPFDEGREALVEKVHFDLAVTVKSSEASGAGGSISILQISLDGKKSKSQEEDMVSRIQFSVRIIPPLTRIRDDLGPRTVVAVEGGNVISGKNI